MIESFVGSFPTKDSVFKGMKMKRVFIFVAVVLGLWIIVAGIYFSRPVYRLERALKKGDALKAAEIHAGLSGDDYSVTSDMIYEYCNGVISFYGEGGFSYEEASEKVTALIDCVDYDRKQRLRSDLIRLENSNISWENGSEYYDKGEFANAAKEYENVSYQDYHYDEAQEKLKNCYDVLYKEYVGEWVCRTEMGEGVLEKNGLDDYGEDYIFHLELKLSLSEDKVAIAGGDYEKYAEDYKKYVESMVDVSRKRMIAEHGISEEDIDNIFIEQYGMSYEEFFIKSTYEVFDPEEELVDEKYAVKMQKDELVFYNENGEVMRGTIEGENIVFRFDKGTNNQFMVFGVDVPLVFSREEK